jgi:hypothetical protein
MLNELENTQEVVQETPAVEQEQVQVQHQEEARTRHFKELRDRTEAAERRSAELERMMQMNMNQHQGNKIVVEEDDSIDVSDDAYIEGKQFKKILKSVTQELKNTKKQFQEYQQQSSSKQAEMLLKSQYSDFDAVVTTENIKSLEFQKPALYRAILANQDLYDRGSLAYELIKSSGVMASNAAYNSYSAADQKIDQNKAKPRSIANVAPQASNSPLVEFTDRDRRVLTDDQRRAIVRQAREAAARR